jgi:hypothetical protein
MTKCGPWTIRQRDTAEWQAIRDAVLRMWHHDARPCLIDRVKGAFGRGEKQVTVWSLSPNMLVSGEYFTTLTEGGTSRTYRELVNRKLREVVSKGVLGDAVLDAQAAIKAAVPSLTDCFRVRTVETATHIGVVVEETELNAWKAWMTELSSKAAPVEAPKAWAKSWAAAVRVA